MRKARFLASLALGALLFVTIRLAVAPLGDTIAGVITERVIPAPSLAPPSNRAAESEPGLAEQTAAEPGPFDVAESLPAGSLPRRVAARAPTPRRETLEETKDGGARVASPGDAPRGTIVVPASVVSRAVAKRDVAATNAIAPDGAPLGARLAGVSKYRAGLRDGDVVVSVAGTRTPTVEAMVAVGLQAASGGATRLSGRVVRGEATYDVVIELPK